MAGKAALGGISPEGSGDTELSVALRRPPLRSDQYPLFIEARSQEPVRSWLRCDGKFRIVSRPPTRNPLCGDFIDRFLGDALGTPRPLKGVIRGPFGFP